MPIYNFRCPACAHELSQLAKYDDPPPACEACGAEAMERQVSRTAFHLKGGGWYAQGYGSTTGGASGSAKPSTPSTPTPTPSSGSSSD